MKPFANIAFASTLSLITFNATMAGSPPKPEPIEESFHRNYQFVIGGSIHSTKADSDIRDYGVIVTDSTVLGSLDGERENKTVTVESDYETGFDVYLGYILNNTHGFFVHYDGWDQTDKDFTATTFPQGYYNAVEIDDAIALSNFAKIHYDYDSVKMYYRHTLPALRHLTGFIMLGAHWASIDVNKFTQHENYVDAETGDAIDGQIEHHSHSKFDGIGPFVGFTGRYLPFGPGFGIFGTAEFSAFSDDVSGRVVTVNTLDENDFTQTDKLKSSDRIVYHTLVKAGVDYFHPFGEVSGVRVAFGYQSEEYFNSVRSQTPFNVNSGFRRSGIVGELEIII